MKSSLRRTFCLGIAAFLASPCFALPPVASLIAPGDIIFTEFFDGWHKLDPATGAVTQLPWPKSSNFTDYVEFDVDGAILFDDSGDQIMRLNPTSLRIRNLNVPGLSFTDGFVVEPNGDLLIANNRDVSRFSRDAGTTSVIIGDTFFAPHGIAQRSDGRVFITEFFDGLWEIDASANTRSLVTNFDFSIPDRIAVQSDGDLIVENFSPGVLYEVDPDTGSVSLFTDDLPTFVRDFAIDADDNLWLTSTDGVFRYGPGGGAKTLVAYDTFFSPRAIAIVPQTWVAPPIPEPSAMLLAKCAACATTAFKLRRSNSRS
jgi:streptogramin lyase